MAATTRAAPARDTASAPGGALPGWQQGSVRRSSARGLARGCQSVDLRVGRPVALVPALAADVAVPDDDGADEGVRLDVTAAALRQFQGAVHPLLLVCDHGDGRGGA